MKQLSESAALQLTDGSATVVLMEAIDAATGAVLLTTPGFHHNNLPTATCKSDQPQDRR